MCTMIFGHDVVAPGTLVMATNRDEDPARPSDPPGVLAEDPRVVGGRDRLAGGTWLAIRERRAAVAMLNRREDAAPHAGRRSRGLLALDVAATAAEGDFARSALDRAREEIGRHAFAAFSLLFLSPSTGWLMSGKAGEAPRIEKLEPGWHVITHADLDDPGEPRTAWLLAGLQGWTPRTPEEAERGLIERLRGHGDGTAGGTPPVCIHGGRMITVSAAAVWLAPGEARYRHAEGRPCEKALTDYSSLLAGPAGTREKP